MSLKEFVEKFSGNILVIGDIILDEYLYGTAARISREAPVMVVEEGKVEYCLGGAANVANNIKKLNGNPIIIGSIGKEDTGGNIVLNLLDKSKIKHNFIEKNLNVTNSKTRILVGDSDSSPKQVLQIIQNGNKILKEEIRYEELVSKLHKIIKDESIQAVIVSDYDRGVITTQMRVCFCFMQYIPMFVDSKKKIMGITGPKNMTLFPNSHELEEISSPGNSISYASSKLLDYTNSICVVAKNGNKGLVVTCTDFYNGEITKEIPAFGSEAIDTTGAGDTVISAFALAKLAGADNVEAAKIANVAAGLVVMKRGTATITKTELSRGVDDYEKSSD